MIFVIGALTAGIIVLILLQTLAPVYRRRLTALVTFIVGLYWPLEFFYPEHNFLTPWRDSVAELGRILVAFTFGLGGVNLFLIHGRHIIRRTPNLLFSIVFFLGFFAMATAGMMKDFGQNWLEARPGPGQQGFWEASFNILFKGALLPLASTVFSLLAFFIASAAFRAFRARTLEAGLLMATSFLVMMANVPAGPWLTSFLPDEGILRWGRWENIVHWLMTQINTPAMRAILFGVWVGTIGAALRIWLSLERAFVSGP
ncbi:MAG: hypothetical protein NZ959_08670 [Armatimonadetes bacterium]|nr:hypothetical protein [Armatimonadota bacterium]MDW8122543.1 hypothetical protein [Armatimonadota bacterium]